ncbi:MAG: septation protein SpoVG family protein [Candidatus Theseobacter exili]|nr:septation protein SpoVG family protein [Candidatus Theseobacter exili]
MKITQVNIHLKHSGGSKLKAFATITFDDMFVVRDLKIIEGERGLFVAMPSTRVREKCPRCQNKNPIRSRFCSECGMKIPEKRRYDEDQRREEHKDIAHPITAEAREYIEGMILESYREQKGMQESGDSLTDTSSNVEKVVEPASGDDANELTEPLEEIQEQPLEEIQETSEEEAL